MNRLKRARKTVRLTFSPRNRMVAIMRVPLSLVSILRLIFGILAIHLGATQSLQGAGVAVTKEQSFHADKSAKPFTFDQVTDYGRHVKFVASGRTFTIERTTILDYVEVLSSIPPNITSPEEIAPIRKSAEDISDFMAKYPLAEPLLKQNLDALKKVLNAYDSGWVLYQNSWMTTADFSVVKEQLAQLEKEEREKRDKEALERKEELTKIETSVLSKMEANTLKDVEYLIRDSVGTGAFIEITGRLNGSELLYLENDMAAAPLSKKSERDTLYYGGSYQISSPFGGSREVRTYHRDRNIALAHLRDYYYSATSARYSISVLSADSNRIGRSYEPGFRAPDGLDWVNGYFRNDGTWVRGHYRKSSNTDTLVSRDYTPTSNASPSTSPSYTRGSNNHGSVHVKGYFKKNGTYVRPHTRRR